MTLDYTHGRDMTPPVKLSLGDRLHWTFENIIFFFFQYQWPEDNDWRDPFPRNALTMVRFIWLPLTVFVVATMIWKKQRDFMTVYFVACTLIFMFQQTAVMEGRYKKLWEGVAIGAFLNVVCQSKRYKLLVGDAVDGGGISSHAGANGDGHSGNPTDSADVSGVAS